MRALIVEDHVGTASSIAAALQADGFVCDTTGQGEDGLQLGKLYEYDIIILDLMLPDIDGYEVLRRLRAVRRSAPTLVISGLSGIEDRIKSFGIGADDYLVKPFDKRELLARVRAIVRRSKEHAESVVRAGPLTVNLAARTVEIGGRLLHVTKKEYAILELLSLRKGVTVTKETLLNHLYGGLDEPEIKVIDVFVCKLRRKLADASGGGSFIETVWGRGFVLRETTETGRPVRINGGAFAQRNPQTSNTPRTAALQMASIRGGRSPT